MLMSGTHARTWVDSVIVSSTPCLHLPRRVSAKDGFTILLQFEVFPQSAKGGFVKSTQSNHQTSFSPKTPFRNRLRSMNIIIINRFVLFRFSLAALKFREVTVTSLHPPRPCLLAVFSIKSALPPVSLFPTRTLKSTEATRVMKTSLQPSNASQDLSVNVRFKVEKCNNVCVSSVDSTSV